MDLTAYLRDAFGWDDGVTLTAGPRGALGQVWRVDAGPARYALKELFAEPPTRARIEAELTFARRAAAAGVRLPASHPDRAGRYLLTAPGGGWLRLYDWVDLRPVDLAAPDTPERLGGLLARLHRCAPATPDEAPGRWYETVPEADEWAALPAAAWSGRLAERLSTVVELCAAVGPADPRDLIVCHRDLHPENVLADADGLVVIDWDDLGPATAARELARALFDWFCDPTPDPAAMRAMYEAYLRDGGPGRITAPADFTMLLACRLNFLLVQARVAADPRAEARHREWAEREIDEGLRTLPTPGDLAAVLRMAREANPRAE